MPCLYKQSRSSYWFADYTLPDGSRRRISTKKTNRAEAKIVLAELLASAGAKKIATASGAKFHTSKRQPEGESTATTRRVRTVTGRQKPRPRKPGRRRKISVAKSVRPALESPGGAVERRSLTLRDLATLARVCVATVSNALRNDRQVAEHTRHRIQALASQLGYKPNPMVSALMASRARLRKTSEQQIIAYINVFVKREGWRYFASLVDYFEGARDRAAACGYQLEEFWLREPGMNSGKMSDILFHRGIHGVLLGPLERKMGHVSLKWDRFSVATLGYSMTRPSIHRAVPDQLAGMRLALRQLQKTGYRRIALVLNPQWDIRSNKAWTAGFSEYLFLLRASERIRPFFYDQRCDPSRFLAWLRKENPDAIISSNPCVIEWMQDEGFETPRDYGFVSLNRPLHKASYSGIYQNTRAIGAAAVDLIVSQIHQNERGLPEIPKRIVIDPVWLPGSTTRPC